MYAGQAQQSVGIVTDNADGIQAAMRGAASLLASLAHDQPVTDDHLAALEAGLGLAEVHAQALLAAIISFRAQAREALEDDRKRLARASFLFRLAKEQTGGYSMEDDEGPGDKP